MAQVDECICQRGAGEFPGEDIASPILSTTEIKMARGRAEIDAGESLREITLTTLHRPGILPGQLVEVHDALFGETFRARITGVAHEGHGPRLVTTLELLRHVSTD